MILSPHSLTHSLTHSLILSINHCLATTFMALVVNSTIVHTQLTHSINHLLLWSSITPPALQDAVSACVCRWRKIKHASCWFAVFGVLLTRLLALLSCSDMQNGGAIYSEDSTWTLTSCTISGTSVTDGHVSLRSSSVKCVFECCATTPLLMEA